ncbi:hypothetical protein [Bdellovibrio sp. NC01]|uniref:hypothetical protein n=1 Tax=Bdellovibrio sp. NC01 TaxID=2220073 RepID=UPI0011598DD3|nr:hypothetical protein [Bdellovibrio sp. NC01]QDK38358.1 hypothetical protein DOE51_12595 [Bdellovibrio sp. NC01]
MKKRISLSVLLLLGVVTTQFYQNCAPLEQMNDLASMNSASSADSAADDTAVDSPGIHPVEAATKVSARKVHVVSKDYVASIFREVFTSTATPVTNLDALIDKWVTFKGAQFGGSCDMYSSFSTRDCNGSISNTDLGYFTDDNTVRESFRVQMCENVLGVDAGVSAALEKVSLTMASPINPTNVALAHSLFYRGNPPEELTVNTLIDLNTTLTAANAPLKERWRAVLTQVCESPGWQLF